MSANNPKAPAQEVLALQVMSVVPIKRIDTTRLINADAPIDVRPAIDQFLEVVRTLNLMSRRPSPEVKGDGSNSEHAGDNDAHNTDPAAANSSGVESFEALFAVEEGDEALGNAQEAIEAKAQLGDPTSSTLTGGVGAKEALHSDVQIEGVEEGQSIEGGDPSVSVGPAESASEARAALQPSTEEISTQMNNLVFLGYISAVESYLRCLTRQLVLADEHTMDKVANQKISFGAAIHSDRILLPEAFLEDMTFITVDAISNLLRDVIGISPAAISQPLDEYERICQLRHCIVHRFGKLGTKNAIKLGLHTHKSLFEKPIRMSSGDLEDIAYMLVNVVKAINNHVYSEVLKRSARLAVHWTWEFAHDQAAFEKLRDVFASKTSSATFGSAAADYEAFKNECRAKSASNIHYQKQRRVAASEPIEALPSNK